MCGSILPLLPPHKQYCEPCFGGGAIFFAKVPCEHETIGDIDEGVTGFFTILRDRGDEFIELARLTEYNEALYNKCVTEWLDEEDPLRRAWMWWVVARQSYSGQFAHGFSHSRKSVGRGRPSMLSAFRVSVDHLPEVVERLQDTQILSGPALQTIERCDTPDCLHYLDPPYIEGTRRAGGYRHEMTEEQHRELVRYLLAEVSGMVVLSGYAHPIYEPLEAAGWIRHDFETACHVVAKTEATGITGRGSAKKKQKRVESVWLNPRAQRGSRRTREIG